MLDTDIILGRFAEIQRRRDERRAFLKMAAAGTAAIGSLSLLAACNDDNNGTSVTPTPTPSPTPAPVTTTTDQDILNFALNLEYLEAQFYSFATTGQSIDGSLLGGIGTPGAPSGGRQVTFTDPIVAQYAREITADEVAHVRFLRAALGSVAIAQPALDISAAGAFTAAARAAGVVGPTETFDPYASDEAFLLGAFIFEDVGVTAYKGGAPLLSSKVYLEAAAGILAAEAYHAGLIRTILYAKGMQTASLRTNADKISDARDLLDGAPTEDAIRGIGPDDDQGISPMTLSGGTASNIVPTNANGLAFSRTVQQVHNIAYLTRNATTSGGFFPQGTNNNNPAFRMSGNTN